MEDFKDLLAISAEVEGFYKDLQSLLFNGNLRIFIMYVYV